VDSNVWLAYGHYRNGILLAPVTAQRIAEGVAEVAKTRVY
jgi:glycine oxidase